MCKCRATHIRITLARGAQAHPQLAPRGEPGQCPAQLVQGCLRPHPDMARGAPYPAQAILGGGLKLGTLSTLRPMPLLDTRVAGVRAPATYRGCPNSWGLQYHPTPATALRVQAQN